MKKQRQEQSIFLKAIAHAKPKQQRSLLLSLPDDAIKVICEVLHNVLYGELRIPPKQKEVLHKYKQAIRLLGNGPFKPLYRKRKQLSKQKGGFIGTILPIIASLLMSNNV
jgi:hypothetical protein